VTEVTRSLSLLTQETGIDIVFNESIDTWEPIVPSYQLKGSGGTAVASEGCIMVLRQYFCMQYFQNVNEAFV
jgi:hypothetical protein